MRSRGALDKYNKLVNSAVQELLAVLLRENAKSTA